MLHKKLFRDVLQQKWQVIAVTIVILLGTALFDASYLAYQNLQHSYAATQERTQMADVTLQVTRITQAQTFAASQVRGVKQADRELIVSLPVTVPHGRTVENTPGRVTADGRFISIPLGQEPLLNQIVVVSGHYPRTTDELLVERHFAEYQHLVPGDQITIQTPAGNRIVTVSGIAVSPEYLWVARNRQDIFPSPADFGVLFVPRQTLTEIGKSSLLTLTQTHQGFTVPSGAKTPPQNLDTVPSTAESSSAVHDLQLAASGSDGNTLLYTLRPGANGNDVLTAMRSLLGSQNVVTATPRKQQVGVQLLQMDLSGFQEMAGAFPLFFLTVAAFIVAALMNRMVSRERPLIGTLMALGMRRRALLEHYLSFSLLIGILGVLLGTGLGLWMGVAMTHAYATELHIPFVYTQFDWKVLCEGIAMGLIAPVLTGIFPAIKASRLQPAEAMRPFASQTSPHGKGHTRRGRGPLWLLLSLRDLVRRPGRSLGTAIGVIAALILVVTTAGLGDSMTRGMDLSFGQSQRYDLRADFYLPQTASAIVQRIQAIPGVTQVEPAITLPVQVVNPTTGHTYDSVVQGLPSSSNLLQLRDSQGHLLKPQPGKAILSSAIAAKLGIKVGDTIQVRLLPNGNRISVPVQALDFSVIGNSVSMPENEVATNFHLSGKSTTVFINTMVAQRTSVRAALANLPGIIQVQDQQALRNLVNSWMGLMNVMLAVMLLFAVILASSILFNTATLNVLERQREFATMRALGYSARGIAGLVTAGNAFIGLIGLIFGFPLALLAYHQFLKLYTSDLFTMPFWLYPRTIVLAVVGILLVLLLAQWPALRTVARMNLAEASKMRE